MGKDIVKQESPNPGERSRLWDSKDINEVLKENKGTSKTGIIYVNDSIELERDGEAFNKMENLKTLLIDEEGCFDDESVKHLPNSLRVLDCRSIETPVLFPNKASKFQNMRILNFYNSREDLLPIHDLSNLPNLEELSIQGCSGKFTSDKSVCFLSNLKILRIKDCEDVTSVPPLDCPSLVELNFSYCYSLRSIPPLKFTSLKELDLKNCISLQNFPLVVDEFLGKLKILRLENCYNLKSIPPLKLDVLEELDLSNCSMLDSFPPVQKQITKSEIT
ncbi:hypothetical protein P8452_55728 [Trifolium repens]|nr:hypothetical protein P8452_55728 [Trifolium repens]